MTPQTPTPDTRWIYDKSCAVKILGISHGYLFPARSVTRRLFARAHDWGEEGAGDPKLFFQGDDGVYHHAPEPESRVVFEFMFRGSVHHLLLGEFLEKFQVFPPMGGAPS